MDLHTYRVVRRGEGRVLSPRVRRVVQQDVGRLLARELQHVLARVARMGGELSESQQAQLAEGIYVA